MFPTNNSSHSQHVSRLLPFSVESAEGVYHGAGVEPAANSKQARPVNVGR